ncbi:hypothetical protein SONE68_4069 (plasmid) [Lacticaseibacillus paracasei]|nr:hypothetical protein SONE68_4069 [Lacticaseibacillus paracasei]
MMVGDGVNMHLHWRLLMSALQWVHMGQPRQANRLMPLFCATIWRKLLRPL